MITNPLEECPPDEPVHRVNITAVFHAEDGKWEAYCPQWKCQLWGETLSEAVGKITESIDEHNEKEMDAIIQEAIDRNPAAVVAAFASLLEGEGK